MGAITVVFVVAPEGRRLHRGEKIPGKLHDEKIVFGAATTVVVVVNWEEGRGGGICCTWAEREGWGGGVIGGSKRHSTPFFCSVGGEEVRK